MLLLTSDPKPVPLSGVSQLASQCATRKQRPCVVLSGVWRRSGSTVRERRGGGEARVQAGRDGWRKSGRCDVRDKKSIGPAEREGVASSGVWRAIKTFRFRTGSGGGVGVPAAGGQEVSRKSCEEAHWCSEGGREVSWHRRWRQVIG